MSLKLYMDQHVRVEITTGLRRRGIDVLTAEEDGAARWTDSQLLSRASSLGRIFFSQDSDLLAEACRRQKRGEAFVGLVYSRQTTITIRQAIDSLELIATAYESHEMENHVEYIPVR